MTQLAKARCEDSADAIQEAIERLTGKAMLDYVLVITENVSGSRNEAIDVLTSGLPYSTAFGRLSQGAHLLHERQQNPT